MCFRVISSAISRAALRDEGAVRARRLASAAHPSLRGGESPCGARGEASGERWPRSRGGSAALASCESRAQHAAQHAALAQASQEGRLQSADVASKHAESLLQQPLKHSCRTLKM